MKKNLDARLTSAEMGSLWTQYINDTATKQILTYFLNWVEDKGIRKILETALGSANENLSFLLALFKKETFPIPAGFTENDVNVGAPMIKNGWLEEPPQAPDRNQLTK